MIYDILVLLAIITLSLFFVNIINFLTEEDIKILQEGLDLEEIAKKLEE